VETELLEEAGRRNKKSSKTDDVGIFSSVYSEIILEHFRKKPEFTAKHFQDSPYNQSLNFRAILCANREMINIAQVNFLSTKQHVYFHAVFNVKLLINQ